MDTPPPMMYPSPDYFYPPYEVEYVGVPLEPTLMHDDYDADHSGLSTADIIASQSQDYVDEKLAEYQATIFQLQDPPQIAGPCVAPPFVHALRAGLDSILSRNRLTGILDTTLH
uniref:Uncharacterized protein n=1 Tax=Timema douglasi TaxID=61478 RepID=A0A7R8VUV4_TIMDO|nr:unnamed protein product [Timema douglasi]